MTAKVLAAYEALADAYNERIDYKPHNAFYDRPNTLQLLPDVAGKKVLDAACGPGKYAEILLAQGAELTGVDLSPKMVAFAQERNGDRGHFFVHDLAQPFNMLADASFDVVLSALSLDYLPDWSKTIQEFCRLLKPKGVLVCSFGHPFFDYLDYRSKKYFEVEAVSCVWRGFGKPVEVHSYRRPLMECISALTENGFYIDKLVEPKPTQDFAHADARRYRELIAFPAFLCVRAVKREQK